MRKLKRYHNLKECPFCGKDSAEFGPCDAISFEIYCSNDNCRARISYRIPNRWPPGVFVEGKPYKFNSMRMRMWVGEKLVKRWNRRART